MQKSDVVGTAGHGGRRARTRALVETRWHSRLGDDGVDRMMRWGTWGLGMIPFAVGLLITVVWLESAYLLTNVAAAGIVMGGIGAYGIALVAMFRSIKTRVGRRLGMTRRQSRRLKLDNPARFDGSVQRIQSRSQGPTAR